MLPVAILNKINLNIHNSDSETQREKEIRGKVLLYRKIRYRGKIINIEEMI